MSAGAEVTPGEPAPPDRWRPLGGSDFGSTFYRIEALSNQPNKHNVRARASTHNWSPENHLNGLALLSMSLQNVLNFALCHNGVTDTLPLSYPIDDHVWDSPWAINVGVTSMTMMEYVLREEHIEPISREQIRATFDDAYAKYERGEGRTQLERASPNPTSERSSDG